MLVVFVILLICRSGWVIAIPLVIVTVSNPVGKSRYYCNRTEHASKQNSYRIGDVGLLLIKISIERTVLLILQIRMGYSNTLGHSHVLANVCT
jgi:hypothetical protein